jgi:hypothetical protein
VVCCNRKDAYLAKICIASIRYYYPDIAIELVKDPGNGNFNTGDLEQYFNVQVVDFGIPKLGWSGAKFHYPYQQPIGKKILILDADIVFIGPFLERLLPLIEFNDYVVSIEENDASNKDWVQNTYFDLDAIQTAYPLYRYPGYFFNAGQIFLTLGAIDKDLITEFFDPGKYPFWQKNQLFPLVDQSVYNYLLPTLAATKKIKLGKEKFMIWAGSNVFLDISLEEVIDKKNEYGLVHWAGCLRFPYVSQMRRGDILSFFESYFYSHIKMGKFLYTIHKVIPASEYYLKQVYYKLKPKRWLKG